MATESDLPKPVAPPPAAVPYAPNPGVGEPTEVSRRGFMAWLLAGWGVFTAACVTGTAATARFMFPNVLFEPPQSFKAGWPEEYTVGDVDTRWLSRGVWIVRAEDDLGRGPGFYALSTVCTHLGCPPNWLSAENKFKCPCHGSGYRKSGINFEGPAPRPLERFRISLSDDGQILVDKSRKFQYEKGQWSDAEAFLPYSASA